MSNGAVKKLKTSSEEGEAPVQQNSDSEEVESGNIINADGSETGEEDKNETAISDREPETERVRFRSNRVAVVPQDYPDVKMTEEQAEVVETALVESICPDDQGQPIQFSESRYENGALVLTCANGKTHRWLRLTVQKMVPWPGASLVAKNAENTFKGSLFVAWVNYKMGVSRRNYHQMLELIQKQNKGISTTKWRVVRGKAETDKNERLVVWVDNKSFGDLKAHNFKLFLGLAQVKFMRMAEWTKQNLFPSADKNLPRSTTNKRRKPSAREFSYGNFPPTPLPRSVARPVYRYWGAGLSPKNARQHLGRFKFPDWPQRRELASIDIGRHLRGAQFTDVVPSGERTYTNRESRFPDSRQPRSRGSSAGERSRSREASYDRRQHRYVQERGYSPSHRRQPRDTW